MKVIYIFILFFFFFTHGGLCKSDIHIGYRVTVAIPFEYSPGFIGRAFLMESDQETPNFRAALSVEAFDTKYSCSLELFLGDVKVWNSGHYSKFYTRNKCVLELTNDGDLQLKGLKDRVGWRTGTSAQGVERLQILKTGNLVLVDSLNHIKWQSFNFPTDVMLWGQRLNVATRLTSFPINSSSFYTFEIQQNKVALYLNSGMLKYCYWEFKPSKNRNITFVELGSKGLELFNDKAKKIAQITTTQGLDQPLRFLALGNKTGNLGLYVYSLENEKFEASFQAFNSACDLPLACKPYGICTFANTCSCIRLQTQDHAVSSDCSDGISGEFCAGGEMEMLELTGVTSVLKNAPRSVNISKEACEKLCIDDCKCVAALYSSGEEENATASIQECYLYGLAAGVKQVETGTGLTYMVKVPKGSQQVHSKSNVKKWVLILVGVVDGFILLIIVGGFAYYFVRKRRKISLGTDTNT